MTKNYNNSNLKDASRIIRDGGGVTSDRHQTGWVRFAHTAPYRKCGFTLAEVLITLAIVGVVAALTLPNLIAKYQHKKLEVQFKKAYANLYNAWNKVVIDYPLTYEGGHDYYPEIAKLIYAEYSKMKIKHWDNEGISYRDAMKTYTKTTSTIPQCSQPLSYNAYTIVMPDGGLLSIYYNCKKFYASIDTNGLRKPNAFGHDIFVFFSQADSVLEPAYHETEFIKDSDGNRVQVLYPTDKEACSKFSSSTINGITCAKYAIANVCPDDSSKTYWECLP